MPTKIALLTDDQSWRHLFLLLFRIHANKCGLGYATHVVNLPVLHIRPSIHSFISTFCNFIEIFLFRTYSYVLNASFLANLLRICCFSFFWVLLANYLVMRLFWSNQFGCFFVDCSKSSKHVCWLSRKQFQIISFDFKIIIPSKLSSLNCFWEVHVPTVLWQFTAFNTFC